MLEWVYFLRRHRLCNYWCLTVLRDQWELGYETQSPQAQRTLFQYGHPDYFVTVSQYLASPLPEWAVRLLLRRVSCTPRRFPRFVFGHEFFQVFRERVDPDYIDIRIRAAVEWRIRSTLGLWVDPELDEAAREFIDFVRHQRELEQGNRAWVRYVWPEGA